MKIAISASTPDIKAPFDERFGRCPYFISVDPETRQWEAISNPADNELGGAGTLAAQIVANIPVDVVISGKFGPKAYSALQSAGVQMFESGPGSIDDVLDRYLGGELKRAVSNSNMGHHSRRHHR